MFTKIYIFYFAEIVEWILDFQPQNLYVANFYGRNALHLAAANGQLDIVKLLCDRGIQINGLMIYRKQLTTAKDLASQRNHQDVVEYLSRFGAKFTKDMEPEELKQAREDIDNNVVLAKNRYINNQDSSGDFSNSFNSSFTMLMNRIEVIIKYGSFIRFCFSVNKLKPNVIIILQMESAEKFRRTNT